MAVSPALRRRRVARFLLRLRESQRLTARQAAAKAAKLGRALSESKITRLETARIRRPRQDDIRVLLDVYDVTDPQVRSSYLRHAREAAQTGWWDGYRDVLGDAALHADLETGASRIRVFGLAVIPEVVQTDGYARQLVDATLDVDEETAERHVEARMLRKQILARSDAPRLTVVIDETALRKIPEPVRDEQLRYLAQVQRPGVRVHVLPDQAGLHPAVLGGFAVLDFPGDPPVAVVDRWPHGVLVEDPEEVAHYSRLHDILQGRALPLGETRALLLSQTR